MADSNDDWQEIAVNKVREDLLEPYRVTMGTTNNRTYAAEQFHPVLVLGPQRSRKTSGLAVPTILDWQGPAAITSVRTDVLDDTFEWRRRRGNVFIFDPAMLLKDTKYEQHRVNWDVLAHCRDWDGAVRTGRALTEAGRGAGLVDGDFWYSLAGKLLSTHLFAAGANGYTMDDVVRWINTQEEFEVRSLLQATGVERSLQVAESAWSREDRARSSIYTTAEQVMRVFDFTANNLGQGPFFDLDRFLGSSADTIYICAPPDEQDEYRPLFTGLVRTLVRSLYQRNSDAAMGFCPLLLLLDEAGNIAPLRNLDTLATTAAGTRMQLISIFHDMSQIEGLYGSYGASSIINNHSALIVLPGMRDMATLSYVEALLHGERVANSPESEWIGPRPIRSLRLGDSLLVYRNLRPIVLALRSKFTDPRLDERISPGPAVEDDLGDGEWV